MGRDTGMAGWLIIILSVFHKMKHHKVLDGETPNLFRLLVNSFNFSMRNREVMISDLGDFHHECQK